MDPLEELALVVRDRVSGGQIWGADLASWVVEQDAMNVELAATGRRLSHDEPAISPANWTDELRARVRLGISKAVFSRIVDLVRYWRRTISNCAVDALRDYHKGTGTRSGSVRIKTSSSDSFEPLTSRSRDVNSVERKTPESEFEIRELEHCIYEQIKRNFNQNIQAILILLVIHKVSQADIARAHGVSSAAISQNIARHRNSLIKLVQKNCLGEIV